jgi:RNA-directed DNA polymerase
VVARLHRKLRGWANYFCLGPVSNSYRLLDAYTVERLRRWLCAKHKIRGSGYTRYPDEYFTRTLGLVRLPALTRDLPWAKA